MCLRKHDDDDMWFDTLQDYSEWILRNLEFIVTTFFVAESINSSWLYDNYDMILWYDMVWIITIVYDMIWYDMIWYDYDMIWYGMIWYDMIWLLYDMIYIFSHLAF